jgi:Ca2+-binding EF-hand superfamily protein
MALVSHFTKYQEKSNFICSQISKLRECFMSLDGDGSGSIGIEELEDPLIGLGFAETR